MDCLRDNLPKPFTLRGLSQGQFAQNVLFGWIVLVKILSVKAKRRALFGVDASVERAIDAPERMVEPCVKERFLCARLGCRGFG